jgi:hypothetical protein
MLGPLRSRGRIAPAAAAIAALLALSSACARATGAEDPAPSPVPVVNGPGCARPAVLDARVTITTFRSTEGRCVPAGRLLHVRCGDRLDPVVLVESRTGSPKLFLGGRFAVPVSSPPQGAGVVGEAEDVRVSMPADESDWLYVAEGGGVARWLPLPGPGAVSSPPEALLMGDSILAGSEPFVSSALDEWSTRIDAVVGRPSAAGVAIAAQNALVPPDVAVVELGTNDADPVALRSHADGILASFAALPLVLWVNVHSPAPAAPAVNREIRLAAGSVPNAAIANWNAAAPAADLSADGVHLSPGREAVFAEFLAPFLLAWHAAIAGRGATRCLGTVAAAARTS